MSARLGYCCEINEGFWEDLKTAEAWRRLADDESHNPICVCGEAFDEHQGVHPHPLLEEVPTGPHSYQVKRVPLGCFAFEARGLTPNVDEVVDELRVIEAELR